MKRIRLNCDLGEGFGIYRLVDEDRVMPFIDQANIACGFHAGDPTTIYSSLKRAVKHRVEIGAHPSYPDLQGFGRRSMAIEPSQLIDLIVYQVGAIQGMSASIGANVSYVKPHGALYNDMLTNDKIRHSVFAAIKCVGKGELALMMLATNEFEKHLQEAHEYGLCIYFEAFADRRYTAEGKLTSRAESNAVLSASDALQQSLGFTQNCMPFPVDSICVHGDTPEAIALVKAIRTQIDKP